MAQTSQAQTAALGEVQIITAQHRDQQVIQIKEIHTGMAQIGVRAVMMAVYLTKEAQEAVELAVLHQTRLRHHPILEVLGVMV